MRAAVVAGVSVALLAPANAQFWRLFGGPPQHQPQQRQQKQGFPPFGGFFGNPPPPQQQQAPPADFSRAPSPPSRKPDAVVTTPVVVMGDAMADWLAYGLEDAFAEQPEIAILRKHRTFSGLIRYDTRRDVEWAQVVKEIIAADKPKIIVMMVGLHDRQVIRERVAATAPPARQNQKAPAGKRAPAPTPAPIDPELQAKQSADRQNAEQQELPPGEPPEQSEILAPEPGRGANAGAAGTFEFRSEKWEAAYIRRIEATIAALKSAGAPVFWVGLPPQRGPRTSADTVYLNELYRQQVEKAGLVYVDVWDGFVDTGGQYAAQGPDFEGQLRRLRSGDGVYFTKAGARKLAHYVEREIQRAIANRGLPIALPAPEPANPGRPGGPTQRPLAGPVIPLTASTGGPSELLGGGRTQPIAADPVAIRVLTKGEPVPAAGGRADDFSWPRNNAAIADPPPPPVEALTRPAPAAGRTPGSKANESKQPVERRQRPNPPAAVDGAPRPPVTLRPSAAATQGTVR